MKTTNFLILFIFILRKICLLNHRIILRILLSALTTISLNFLGILIFDQKSILFNMTSQFVDIIDELLILVHDIEIVLTVDLILFFKTFLKWMMWRLQISLLIDIFLPNIWVHLHILHCSVLHIVIQMVKDCSLQLVMVVNILHNPVNIVLELLDEVIVLTNICSWDFYHLLHLFLPISKIINCKT